MDKKTMKRKIRQNVWGNWNGYEGTRKVREFGNNESSAKPSTWNRFANPTKKENDMKKKDPTMESVKRGLDDLKAGRIHKYTPAARTDIAMENIAALDMLARQWGDNSPVVERFEKAVNAYDALSSEVTSLRNAHEELVDTLKQLANIAGARGMDKVVITSLVLKAWDVLARAEGK